MCTEPLKKNIKNTKNKQVDMQKLPLTFFPPSSP